MKSQIQPKCFGMMGVALLATCVLPFFGNAEPKPRQPLPPWPEETLLILGFDEPLAGAYASRAAAAVDGAIWAPSWSGYALNRQGTAVKPATLPVIEKDRWLIGPEEGAIRFWFRPDWSSGVGPGDYARLLELVTESGKDTLVWWSLYVSPDGRALYLSGQGSDGPADFIKAEIEWKSGQWHLIALSYDQKETFLHVDSELVGTGPGLPTLPPTLAGQTMLSIGSDGVGKGVAQGQFDELCTFPRPLTDEPWSDSLYLYYSAYSEVAAKGPVTEAEEAAMRQAATEYMAMNEADPAGDLKAGEGGAQLNLEPGPIYLLVPQIVGTNVHLTLWGGQPNQSYNILYSPVLPANNWVTLAIGAMGQTNFVVPMLGAAAFYRAAIGHDWDGDGVPNWIDAQPSNPNVGALAVTIDWPAHGSVFQ
ncbi:MAG: LamG domain-containing protein [Verrucomicrobiae bacterium]|nr:LamG domain-containing protein [Verrucomicrobiae bacterium]